MDDAPPQDTYLELDSHDTCYACANCRIIEYTNRSCEVTAFSKHYDVLSNVPIVKDGTANDAPYCETYTLVHTKSLYLGEYMKDLLLCLHQVRCNGVIVDDIPKHLAPNPQITTHSIYFPNEGVGKWNKIRSKYDIKQTQTEPYSTGQNHCESTIKELQKKAL